MPNGKLEVETGFRLVGQLFRTSGRQRFHLLQRYKKLVAKLTKTATPIITNKIRLGVIRRKYGFNSMIISPSFSLLLLGDCLRLKHFQIFISDQLPRSINNLFCIWNNKVFHHRSERHRQLAQQATRFNRCIKIVKRFTNNERSDLSTKPCSANCLMRN